MTEELRIQNIDCLSLPGDTISDILEERDWSQNELATRTGFTPKHISQLIQGKAPINEETALKLEKVLGSTARFWLNREAYYRERLARKKEFNQMPDWISWVENFSLRELMNIELIPVREINASTKPLIAFDLLRFFGVASPNEWHKQYGSLQLAFKRTKEEQSNVEAIVTWLRMGEISSERMDCAKFDKNKFESALNKIRTMTCLEPTEFHPKLQELCRGAGVAFVVIPAIRRAHVSGVARWINPHKPLIQLSLYGKFNDRFWFTFFHEAAHILLHDKKDVFLDEFTAGKKIGSKEEQEADAWARDFLIPQEYIKFLPTLTTKAAVRSFAEVIGIHPGIVVGRLQHDKIILPSWMNDMKVGFKFVKKLN